MDDLISRQAAIDAAMEELDGGTPYDIPNKITALPSAQPEQDREFIKLTVRNSNGRPYYSIIYLEFDDNGVGHDFEGYSSYSLDVISDYLKKYFMPSAQPNLQQSCNQLATDVISRQEAIDALKEHRALYCDNTPDSFSKLSYAEKSRVDELDTAIATIVNLPSADPKLRAAQSEIVRLNV